MSKYHEETESEGQLRQLRTGELELICWFKESWRTSQPAQKQQSAPTIRQMIMNWVEVDRHCRLILRILNGYLKELALDWKGDGT